MPSIVVVGMQWGDEGKGKIVDLLSEKMDINVRYNGGSNAGHTIVNGDQSFKFHLIPSGIIYPHVIPVIGAGVVIDLEVLFTELEGLEARGIDTKRLLISGNAHLTMPYHKVLDQLSEKRLGKMAIGTTRRGIGPTYADKAYRSGIRVQDLLDLKIFYEKLVAALKEKNRIIKAYGREPLDPEKIMQDYIGYAEKIKEHVIDVARYLNNALDAGSDVLLEGAQGTFLDIDYGTYPFVTSSSAIAGGATTGAGIPPKKISAVLGVAKAYTTRVGSGPFPTELEDEIGNYLAEKGYEYGTTTGRKRRCGWLDVVLLKYASMINGTDYIALTKMDVLSGLETIKICVAYEYEGKTYEDYPSHQTIFHKAKPIYEEIPGWKTDISDVTSYAQLPKNAKNFIKKIEELVKVPIGIISVGPKRSQTIFKEFYLW
ncbi:MAG: adenylosuccinate synthase [Actinobacteria bacterium]|nr:adenylosuccinate synthase [Actinomycetota bacterium]